MKNSIFFALILLLFVTNTVTAQTTIINPAGDGGFETGPTFVVNGWQTAQSTGGTHSKWAVGTAVVNSGSRAVYISSDNGATNTYNTGSSRIQHFYRDVTIPAGEPYITLSFNWKGQGQAGNDYLRVFLVPTSTTPAAASALPTANQIGPTLEMQGSWQTFNATLPCGLAGTTQRLVFSFRCNNNSGTQPPHAVDDISLISAPIPTCSSVTGTFTNVAVLPYSSGAGTTCGAGNEINSTTTSVSCAGTTYSDGEDQIWTFTPLLSGAINVNLTSTSPSSSLSLYTGCPVGTGCISSTCVAATTGGGLSLNACVTAGTQYWLVLDGTSSPGCFAYSNLTISAPFSSCLTALGTGVVNVASLPYTSTGRTTCGKMNDIRAANVSAVCGSAASYDGEDEVFYFTATSSGIIQVALSSGGSFTSVSVYDGCPANLPGGCVTSSAACIAFAQGSSGNKGLCFNAVSGTTYYVVVDSDFPPLCNGYDISISAPQAFLAGTVCSNAPAITLPFTAANHTTTCYGNDYDNASIGSCGTIYESGEDRVYSLTVTAATCIGIRLSNASTANIGFQVYNGCPGAAGTTCLGNGGGTNPLNGAVTLPAAGTYYIVVDTWAAPSNATYDILITDYGLGQANDLPCNADPLALNVNLSGDNSCSGSASEPATPSCWTGGTVNTVWYSVVAPASGQLRIRTGNGTLSNTQIAVFSGTCGSLTEIACNDDAPTCGGSTYTNSEVAIGSLTAGTTYYIAVDGTNNLTGTFDIIAVDGAVGFPAAAGSDCSSPNPVCNSTIPIGNPGYQAYGNTCDFTGAGICLTTGERGAVWYSIPINAAGVLEFDIVPNDWLGAPSTVSTDYDFAIWKTTGSGATNCAGIAAGAIPNRCNYDGLGVTGIFATGNSPGAYPGFNNAYESNIAVVAGEVYLLCISNYTNSTSGFTLYINTSSPVNYAAATSVTWTGGNNTTQWVQSPNWGGCTAPTCGVDAVVAPAAAVQPVLPAGTYNVRNLTINPGASLTLQSGAVLNICGDFTNSGSLIAHPNSTIVFNNGSTVQSISGSFVGSDKMGNLTINKTGGSVIMNSAIDIGGNFTTSNATSILNTNGLYVRIAGNFNNNGGSSTFSNTGTTGTLEFNGTGAQTYNQGSSTLTLNNVEMNNTGTGVTLSTNMVLGTSGVLTLTNGRINTGIREVQVTNGATAACTAGNTGSFVAGNLRRTLSGAAGSYDLPVGHATQGYQRANITFTTATTIPQLLARFDPWTIVPNGPVSSECVIANYNVLPALNNGYWTITASANPTSGNYNVSLYNTNFTNSAGAAGWTVMKAANIASAWGLQGTCVTTSTAAQTSRTGLNGFSVFASAQTNTPLPIELLSFTGTNEGDKNVLRWVTATEENNDYFTLERSTDGISFVPVGRVDGAGNSSQILNYIFTDNFPATGENYYRLRQTDFNGASTVSEIILINYHPGNIYVDNLHPNPTTGDIIFDFVSPESNEIHIVVTDIAGRIVLDEVKQTDGGRMQISTQLTGCGAGVYLLKITDERKNFNYTARLVHE
jgi:Secretion system C-terminal sorting domain